MSFKQRILENFLMTTAGSLVVSSIGGISFLAYNAITESTSTLVTVETALNDSYDATNKLISKTNLSIETIATLEERVKKLESENTTIIESLTSIQKAQLIKDNTINGSADYNTDPAKTKQQLQKLEEYGKQQQLQQQQLKMLEEYGKQRAIVNLFQQ